jgi:Family of unknown function (DUF5706)
MGKKHKRQEEEASPGAHTGQFETAKPGRSGETLFRILSSNQVTLSQMADTKAHIMLTICAGVITLSLGRVFHPESARYAAIVLISSALVSALLAVLALSPRYGRPDVPPPDDPRFNLLFFNHYATISEDEFTARMSRVITDNTAVREALLRDIYSQGKVLAHRKYRYLILCYRTFITGVLVSGLLWVWGLLTP